MSNRSDQAWAAMQHAGRCIDQLGRTARQFPGHEGRLAINVTLQHLLRRQDRLLELVEQMDTASDQIANDVWTHFVLCYEQFLQAVEEAKDEVAKLERLGNARLPPARASRRRGQPDSRSPP